MMVLFCFFCCRSEVNLTDQWHFLPELLESEVNLTDQWRFLPELLEK